MREAFAVQKLLTFFQQKNWRILDINIRIFNKTLTNDVVSFEQPGPVNYALVPIVTVLVTVSVYYWYTAWSDHKPLRSAVIYHLVSVISVQWCISCVLYWYTVWPDHKMPESPDIYDLVSVILVQW